MSDGTSTSAASLFHLTKHTQLISVLPSLWDRLVRATVRFLCLLVLRL